MGQQTLVGVGSTPTNNALWDPQARLGGNIDEDAAETTTATSATGTALAHWWIASKPPRQRNTCKEKPPHGGDGGYAHRGQIDWWARV